MSLFGEKKVNESVVKQSYHDAVVRDFQDEIRGLEQNHEFKVKELQQDHKLELKQKEYDLKHFKDDEVLKLREEVTKLNGELAVAKKENQMLDKLVNVNADIIDVKELVTKLIDKLPEVNIKTLTVSSNGNKE